VENTILLEVLETLDAVTLLLGEDTDGPWLAVELPEECAALASALEIAARRQTTPERATIFTHAQASIKRIPSEELGPGQRYTIQARKQIAVALRKVRSDIAIKIRWCLAQRGIQGHNRQAACWKCFSRRSMYCGAETVFGFGVCALGFVEDTITHRGLNSQAGPRAARGLLGLSSPGRDF